MKENLICQRLQKKKVYEAIKIVKLPDYLKDGSYHYQFKIDHFFYGYHYETASTKRYMI